MPRGVATALTVAPAGPLPPARAPLCDGAWVEVDPADPGVVTAVVVEDLEGCGPFVARLLGLSGPIPPPGDSPGSPVVRVEPSAELGRFCRLALANWCLAVFDGATTDPALLADVGQASLAAGRIGDAAVALDAAADRLAALAVQFRDTPFPVLRTALESACRDTDFVLGPRNRHHPALVRALEALRSGGGAGPDEPRCVDPPGRADCPDQQGHPRGTARLLGRRSRRAHRALHTVGSPPAPPASGTGPGNRRRVPGSEGCERPFLHELLAEARGHRASASVDGGSGA